MSHALPPLDRLLAGGDLRSTGLAARAAQELLRGKREPGEFWTLIEDAAPEVRMRAADALEKASRTSPRLIEGAAGRLLALLESAQPKEVRWHLLQMAPRARWSDARLSRLLPAVEGAFHDRSAIVRACALQALAELAPRSDACAAAFRRQLRAAGASKVPSLRARARKLQEGGTSQAAASGAAAKVTKRRASGGHGAGTATPPDARPRGKR